MDNAEQTLLEEVAQAMRRAREMAGMNQLEWAMELAKQLGKRSDSMRVMSWKWEKKQRVPPATALLAASRIAQTPLDVLMYDKLEVSRDQDLVELGAKVDNLLERMTILEKSAAGRASPAGRRTDNRRPT